MISFVSIYEYLIWICFIFQVVVKKKTCFCCDKEPKEGWIFCSDECIKKHAAKAIEILSRNKSKTSLIGKTHVLVIEPQTNTMLNGPNAPLESNLGE